MIKSEIGLCRVMGLTLTLARRGTVSVVATVFPIMSPLGELEVYVSVSSALSACKFSC